MTTNKLQLTATVNSRQAVFVFGCNNASGVVSFFVNLNPYNSNAVKTDVCMSENVTIEYRPEDKVATLTFPMVTWSALVLISDHNFSAACV